MRRTPLGSAPHRPVLAWRCLFEDPSPSPGRRGPRRSCRVLADRARVLGRQEELRAEPLRGEGSAVSGLLFWNQTWVEQHENSSPTPSAPSTSLHPLHVLEAEHEPGPVLAAERGQLHEVVGERGPPRLVDEEVVGLAPVLLPRHDEPERVLEHPAEERGEVRLVLVDVLEDEHRLLRPRPTRGARCSRCGASRRPGAPGSCSWRRG